jgi:CheY-like chemotaxis protein
VDRTETHGRQKGRRFLLVEQSLVMRQTIALTAGSLRIGEVHQSGSIALALPMLESTRFDGVVIAVDQDGDEKARAFDYAVLERIRDGRTASEPDLPIVVLTAACDASFVAAMRALRIERILVKPFRARTLLEALADMSER